MPYCRTPHKQNSVKFVRLSIYPPDSWDNVETLSTGKRLPRPLSEIPTKGDYTVHYAHLFVICLFFLRYMPLSNHR